MAVIKRQSAKQETGMFRQMLLVALACLVVGLPGLVQAEDRPVIVAIESNDYYPHYQIRNDEFTGFAGDLFRAFARDVGLEIEFQSVPLKRILLEMPRGDIDLKYPDNPKWNRRAKADRFVHSSPVVRYLDGIMVLPENTGRPLADIREMGTLYGFTPWPVMDRISDGHIRVVEIVSLEGLIRRMGMNGFDGIYANIDVARHVMASKLKQPGLLRFDPTLPFADSYYAASTVTRPDLLRRFDNWQKNATALKAQLEQKYKVGLSGILADHIQPPAN